jgi:predicted alpha/beta superfamily hydrolase
LPPASWRLACSARPERRFALASTHSLTLKSDLSGRDHELTVSLPDSYDRSPDKRYPVLYFMDAYWDMPLLAAIHDNLVWDNVLPELIMVGFSYPGEQTDYGDLRGLDLTPTQDPAENLDSGHAEEFLRFIESTVIPYVESHYRTDRARRALSGASLGGLFTLYAMCEKPDLFQRYIAMSPDARWDKGYLSRLDDTYAKGHRSLPARLFLSVGGDEYAPAREPVVAFQEKLQARGYEGLALMSCTIAGERHAGVKAEGYTRGLRWVFQDIAPTGPGGLEREQRREDAESWDNRHAGSRSR